MKGNKVYSMEYVVPIIYQWLETQHLLKASRALLDEYADGKTIPSPDASLDTILHCYSVMCRTFSKLDSKKTKHENKKSKKKKEPEDATISAVKKKKEPFVPPGTWICPEMEERLGDVFDRQKMSKANENSLDHKKSSFLEIDSNSEDEEGETQKTIVKLSNGIVLESDLKSPSSKKKNKGNEETSTGFQSQLESASENTEKVKKKKKKKKKSDSSEENTIEEKEIQDQKKKKGNVWTDILWKKIVKATNATVYFDSIFEVFTSSSSLNHN